MSRSSALPTSVRFLVVVAVSLTPGANAVAGAWSELFQLDCGGNVNFMNNHLLAAQGDVKDVIDMAQFISGGAMFRLYT